MEGRMTAIFPLMDSAKPALPSAPVAPVPFRFQVGERTLFSVSRRLARAHYDLRALAADAEPPLGALDPDADGMILRSLPLSQLPGIECRAGGFTVYVRDIFPRYYARLDGDFESYLARFSAKSRSGLKRKLRKLAELSGGGIDVREYRAPAEIAEFHRLARQVSKLTYQERLLDAGLPDSEAYRAEMMRLAAEDRARGYLLFLDGRPVSYLFTPIEDGCVIYAYLGYDPALGQHSPGTILQYAAMERLFAERRFRFFDFTEGDGQHKRQFATGHFDCANVMLLRPTVVNRTLVAAHKGFVRGIERLRDAAERAGVKTQLKALLRR